MEGGGEALPADLRDLAGKVGRRPPAVLLRGLRADTVPAPPAPPATPAPVRGAHPPLAERLRTLRLELVSAAVPGALPVTDRPDPRSPQPPRSAGCHPR